ncbi:MAG TPA: phosphopantothenoylcysteine decarboxylase [Phycisphaerae bacterium]|nr:phosphopantothenoylcysteine decarboxylase [Phycisphaerae bacterium]
MRILITAGPTREHLDPVRYVSNASSGRIGCALAEAALDAGHQVTLVLGPCPAEPPDGAEVVRITSAQEMFEAVAARFDACDVFLASAAVADYRPVAKRPEKIKKGEARLTVELERTPDILAEMSSRRRKQILVGFCLETEDLERRARRKLEAKGLDLVVANGPEAIAADRQDALLIRQVGPTQRLTGVTKAELASAILEAVRTAG